MIIGIVAGLVFLGLRAAAEGAVFGKVTFTVKEDLSYIYIILDDLRVIATPLALVVLGGQFEFSAVRGMTKEIIVGTVFPRGNSSRAMRGRGGAARHLYRSCKFRAD